MQTGQVLLDASDFARILRKYHQQRKQRAAERGSEANARRPLKRPERTLVLSKTGGRCHVCGGAITSSDWQADHILAYDAGGTQTLENYLPAHSICNNYRWHYDAEEFQWILKLGVWLRTQIEKGSHLGREAGQKFCEHERRRFARRAPRRVK
jgi:5-methylcytosine-specific restriction endonuclease McrA